MSCRATSWASGGNLGLIGWVMQARAPTEGSRRNAPPTCSASNMTMAPRIVPSMSHPHARVIGPKPGMV
eukprot:3965956-Karenia_brevis.AAC.1